CAGTRSALQAVQCIIAIGKRAVCRSSMSPQLLGNVTVILRIGQNRVAVLMVVQLVGELRRTGTALPPPLVVLVAHRGQEACAAILAVQLLLRQLPDGVVR